MDKLEKKVSEDKDTVDPLVIGLIEAMKMCGVAGIEQECMG